MCTPLFLCLPTLLPVVADSEVYSFSLEKNEQMIQGYFVPSKDSSAITVLAIPKSGQEARAFIIHLSKQLPPGIGLVVLDNMTAGQIVVEDRYYSHRICLDNLSSILPNFEGELIIIGESDGGLIATKLASESIVGVASLSLHHETNSWKEFVWKSSCFLQTRGFSTTEIHSYTTSLEQQLFSMSYHSLLSSDFWKSAAVLWDLLLNETCGDYFSQTLVSVYGVHCPSSFLARVKIDQIDTKIDDSHVLSLFIHQDLCDLFLGNKYRCNSVSLLHKVVPHFMKNVLRDVLTGRGEVGIGAKESKSSDGNEKRSVEVDVKYRDDHDRTVGVRGERSEEKDRSGNKTKETSIEMRASIPFHD